MTDEPTERESAPVEPGKRSAVHTERRAFLGAAARKAIYVAPVVFALSATKAYGSNVFFSFCVDEGSPCLETPDCCPGLMCPGNPADKFCQP